MSSIKHKTETKKERKGTAIPIGSLRSGPLSRKRPKKFELKGIASKTPLEKVALAMHMITKNQLEELKNSIGLDYTTLSTVLSVSRATLINKKGNAKFNQAQSERILALADIYAYGYEVFEDEKKFNHWIAEPTKALSGQKPLDLLYTQFGREEVKRLIGRIDYGVYS